MQTQHIHGRRSPDITENFLVVTVGQDIISVVEKRGVLRISEISSELKMSRSSVWNHVNNCDNFLLGWEPRHAKRGIKWCRIVRLR